MMKFAVLLGWFLMSVVARPGPAGQTPALDTAIAAVPATPVPILLDERTAIDALGGYGFRFQSGDGLTWVEQAVASGPFNEVTRTGQYRFVHPDGTPHLLTYTAGVGGFQPVSDLLPTPHPLEPWHIEQIEFAARQKAEAAAAAAATAAETEGVAT